MASTLTDVKCPHCGAGLPAQDMAEGWCDSCGKRLPSSFTAEDGPKRVRTAETAPGGAESERRGGSWRWLLVALPLLGALAALAVYFNGR